MNFFLLRNGNKQGPYPIASLAEMNRNGNVLPSDHIWVEGAPSWVPVSNYLAPKAAAGPPPLPTAPAPMDPATAQMVEQVEAGGRFVVFPYCISILVMSFKRSSGITFLRRDQDGAGPAIGYSMLSGLFGWWGFPWGLVWTVASLISNARGGRDVTLEVLTERIGATAAAGVLARRQKPASAGWLLNSFRVGLVATPVILYLLVSGLLGGSVAEDSGSDQVRSAFYEANRQIDANHGTVAFGNSSRAIAVADDVSRSMKMLRQLGFEGGKKDGVSVSKHEFLAYCDLRDGQCIVLIHVPELRRFTAEAKNSLAEMAWGRTQAALRLQQAGTPGMKIIVGMRGIALYDRTMTGSYVVDPDAKSSGRMETIKGGRDELEQHFNEALQMPGLSHPTTNTESKSPAPI